MKYILTMLLLCFAIQGYCDRYLVSNVYNVNEDLRELEKKGYAITNVEFHKSETVDQYIIKFR